MSTENIRPSEVSEILLQQLKEIDTSLQFEEVGTVLQVSDGAYYLIMAMLFLLNILLY